MYVYIYYTLISKYNGCNFRRILNELSADNSSIAVAKIEEESNESHTTDSDDDDLNDSRMLDSASPVTRSQLARLNGTDLYA
jgi:hypothetical protein